MKKKTMNEERYIIFRKLVDKGMATQKGYFHRCFGNPKKSCIKFGDDLCTFCYDTYYKGEKI